MANGVSVFQSNHRFGASDLGSSRASHVNLRFYPHCSLSFPPYFNFQDSPVNGVLGSERKRFRPTEESSEFTMDAFVFDESEKSGAGGKIPLNLISSKFFFFFSFYLYPVSSCRSFLDYSKSITCPISC